MRQNHCPSPSHPMAVSQFSPHGRQNAAAHSRRTKRSCTQISSVSSPAPNRLWCWWPQVARAAPRRRTLRRWATQPARLGLSAKWGALPPIEASARSETRTDCAQCGFPLNRRRHRCRPDSGYNYVARNDAVPASGAPRRRSREGQSSRAMTQRRHTSPRPSPKIDRNDEWRAGVRRRAPRLGGGRQTRPAGSRVTSTIVRRRLETRTREQVRRFNKWLMVAPLSAQAAVRRAVVVNFI